MCIEYRRIREYKKSICHCIWGLPPFMDILSLPPIKAKAYEQYLCGTHQALSNGACCKQRLRTYREACVVIKPNRRTLSHVPGQFQCMNWILGGPMELNVIYRTINYLAASSTMIGTRTIFLTECQPLHCDTFFSKKPSVFAAFTTSRERFITWWLCWLVSRAKSKDASNIMDISWVAASSV